MISADDIIKLFAIKIIVNNTHALYFIDFTKSLEMIFPMSKLLLYDMLSDRL